MRKTDLILWATGLFGLTCGPFAFAAPGAGGGNWKPPVTDADLAAIRNFAVPAGITDGIRAALDENGGPSGQKTASSAVLPGYLTDPSTKDKAAVADDEYPTYIAPENLRFPYVSTYYVKPVVKDTENVLISYFTTDWDSSKIRYLDDSKRFDIYLEYGNSVSNDMRRVVNRGVKSGDGSFNLGPLPVGEYDVCVWSVDCQNGLESHRVWQEFRVRDNAYFTITEEQTYRMTREDLADYGIAQENGRYRIVKVETPSESAHVPEGLPAGVAVPDDGYVIVAPATNGVIRTRAWKTCSVIYGRAYDTNKVEQTALKTTAGLQKLIDDAAEAGFRKLVLLPGTYRISAHSSVKMRSGLTVDMNGAVFKLNSFTGASCTMVSFLDCDDAHLVNGVLEGDYYEHDYAHSPNNSEWPLGFRINGALYSTIEDVTIQNITGYGGGCGGSSYVNEKGRNVYTMYSGSLAKPWEAGGLDPKTGKVIPGSPRFTCGFSAIPDGFEKGKSFQISKYLGYQGIATRSWWMTLCWYNEAKEFISSQTAFQYRENRPPKGAKYFRVSVDDTTLEKAQDSQLRVMRFFDNRNCGVIHCLFDRCRCVGYAPAASKNQIFRGNEIIYSGENAARCAFDAEDGWDQMQDMYLCENYIHDCPHNNSLLTCCGHDFVFERNRCDIHNYGRTHSTCVRDNVIKYANFECGGRMRSGYGRYENNLYLDKLVVGGEGKKERTGAAPWFYVISGLEFSGKSAPTLNVFGRARLVGCLFRDMKSITASSAFRCTFENCEGGNFPHMPGGRWIESKVTGCNFRNFDKTNDFVKCSFVKTSLYNFQNKSLARFTGCTFDDTSLGSFSANQLLFSDCSFDKSCLSFAYWQKPAVFGFAKCKIGPPPEGKPFMKMAAYNIDRLSFADCEYTGTEPLVNLSDVRAQPTDDQPASLSFTRCKFTGISHDGAAVTASKGNSVKKISIAFDHCKIAHGADFMKKGQVHPAWTLKSGDFL